MKYFHRLFSFLILISVFSHSGRAGEIVNDVQSQLNQTEVSRIETPNSIENIQRIVRSAKSEGRAVSIAAGRHAMGGQQFGKGTVLINMNGMKRILNLDQKKGIVEVETGIQWPELIHQLIDMQKGKTKVWSIRQKQTGTDRLSIGGAISANIHGRGLIYKPFIQDIESFILIDANGDKKTCSRNENKDLFYLTTGGYGLFGVIASAKIRLTPRFKTQRIVEIIDIKDLISGFEDRIRNGFLYGDFQFNTDGNSDEFLRTGVFSCYQPADPQAIVPESKKELSEKDWRELYHMVHVDRKKAFEKYSDYYLTTNKQIYWSDLQQLSFYVDDYHKEVSQRLGDKAVTTEMITEIYVPRSKLVDFMDEARSYFKNDKVELIYGTIRLIEKDEESFLAWAKQQYVCVIFNLHVIQTEEGLARAAKEFQTLIDMAVKRQGSYYLTYHRFARKDQVLACYPQFPEFLGLKKKYDPEERFQSEWYRHYKKMFSPELNESK